MIKANTMAYKKAPSGYMYCLANDAMPGIVKVGMTTQTPTARLTELNRAALPMPYYVAFALAVKQPYVKEQKVHALLNDVAGTDGLRQEFFRVEISVVRKIFDLFDGVDDGKWWDAEADAEADDAEAYTDDDAEADDADDVVSGSSSTETLQRLRIANYAGGFKPPNAVLSASHRMVQLSSMDR